MQEWLDLVKMILALALMGMASLQDLRERMAKDVYWVVMGIVGLISMAASIFVESLPLEHLLLVLATATVFLNVFWDNEYLGKAVSYSLYALSLLLFGFGLYGLRMDDLRIDFLMPYILFWIFLVLYMLDIIKGGADTKCLMALSILFPLYPSIGVLPLIPLPAETVQSILPFAVMVLFFASLFSMFSLFYFLAVNIKNHELRFPQSLLGYRLPIDIAEKGHYWPMERVENGGVLLRSTPQEENFSELRSVGVERVWVTPKIPLLVPMTAAVLFLVVVGNPLFLLL